MDWFRMYSEFASDPKVQSMSEAMQRRLMMLLCLRCSNTLVTLQDDEIAFALRITDEELALTKTLFIRKNFINDEWEIMQWDKRQFVSDSSAARVAKHRAAKKEVRPSVENEGGKVCNVTVTPQNRTDTEQNQNRTDSVPNGTGVPPTEKVEDPKSPADMNKDELWSVGKSILQQQGMPAAQCGSFVGKLVKDYGDVIVIEAVRAAVVERPADAVSFLKASCMARKGEGGKTLIPWHATDAGVIEKGLSLNPPIKSLPGETGILFKARVIAAMENGGKAPAAKRGPSLVIREDNSRGEMPAGLDLKSLVRIREQA